MGRGDSWLYMLAVNHTILNTADKILIDTRKIDLVLCNMQTA